MVDPDGMMKKLKLWLTPIAGVNTTLKIKREIINKLPVSVTPCLVKVHSVPVEPTIDGYVLAIAADKRVYFPGPYTGEWYPDGKDITEYVTRY